MYQHEIHIHNVQYLKNGKIHKIIMLKVTSVYNVHFFRVHGKINRNSTEIGLSAHFFGGKAIDIAIFY